MFDLRILVEDKKLHEVLWKLDGLIAQPPQIVPVRGAKVVRFTNGSTTVKSIVENAGGTLAARFSTRVSSCEPQAKLTMQALKQMVVELGGSPTGAYAMTKTLCEGGILKKQERGLYQRTNH